jgi:hypothetical protein
MYKAICDEFIMKYKDPNTSLDEDVELVTGTDDE